MKRLAVWCVVSVWAASAWASEMQNHWLGRGGIWRTSASVSVFNATTNAWQGFPVLVKAGRGENELPIAGARIAALRLVDAAGVALEYGVWSSDGKTLLTDGTVPEGAEIVLPVSAPPASVAVLRLYWDNPCAWGLGDFWKKRPRQGAPAPFVHVCAPVRTALRETGRDAPWLASEAGHVWAFRLPVLLVNETDAALKGALAAVPLPDAQRMLRAPRFALADCTGRRVDVFTAGSRLFFQIDVPPRTAATCYLYAREGARETAMHRVPRAHVHAQASEIPSDQILIADSGLTMADEEALMRLMDSPANLLRDASFEAPQTDARVWREVGAKTPGVTHARAAGGLFGSHHATLSVTEQAHTSSWPGRLQMVGIKPGQTYFYGAFVSGEDLSKPVSVHEHVLDEKGRALNMGATTSLKAGTSSWTPLFATVTAGAEARSLSIHLTMNGTGTLRHDGALVVACVPAYVGDPETPAQPADTFCVSQVDVVEKVFRETVVTNAAGPFAIDLAREETEAFQLAVRAGRSVARLEACVAPLEGPGGARLPVETGYVDWVPVDHPTAYYTCRTPEWELRTPSRSGQCDGWSGWWPDPIVPKAVCALPANTARAWRLSVRSRASTPPGVYRGKVVWRCDGRVVREDALEARVWDVTLPERPDFAAIYDIRLGHAVWKETLGTNAYERIVSFMAEKKICPDRIPAEPRFWLDKQGCVKADFAAYDAAAERYFDHYRFPVSYMPRIFYCFGWGHPPKKLFGCEPYEGTYPYKNADRAKLSTAWAKRYKEMLSLYWRHMKEKGWADKVVLYISDEPYMRERAIEVQMKALCALIHEVDPAIRVYCSTWHYLDAWDGALDVWGVAHYGAFPTEAIKRLKAAGKRFWFTTDGQACLDTVNCSTERMFPHWCAAWGVEAYEFWGCTWLTYDPWRFGWHSYIRQSGVPGRTEWVRYPAGDGYLIYPPKPGVSDDVCTSIRLEAARDGVEDHALLKALAAREDAPARTLLAAFGALCPIPNFGGRYSGKNLPDPSVLADLRKRALRLLDAQGE